MLVEDVTICMHMYMYITLKIHVHRIALLSLPFSAEKLAVEEKCVKLEQQLSERTTEEFRFKEQCCELQLRVAENASEREYVEAVRQKLVTAEQESKELKVEVCQMQVELKSASSSISSLQQQVSTSQGSIQSCKHGLHLCRFSCLNMISIRVRGAVNNLEWN